MPRMWTLLLALACQSNVTPRKTPDDGGAGALFALTMLDPSSGPASGGTTVTVRGSGFTDTTFADIDGVACGSLTFVSSSQLACVTAGGAPGPATLTVTQGTATATASFTYLATDTGLSDTGNGGDSGTDSAADSAIDSGTDSAIDSGADSGEDSGADTGPLEPVDYCHLQYPCSQELARASASAAVYGWIYEAGVTVGTGAGAGVRAEVGVGPDGSDPASASGWTWAPMSYNTDKDGLSAGDLANDEYAGTFTAPSGPGAYDYCLRVSVDEGRSWTYCDGGGASCAGSGSDDGYRAADAGQLTVR
jgi:hypothetical protein